ncbi:hypothetical protein ZEAMMB73_Zm00001d009051 [Zea mays]|uniref:Uncharacterized protein n=1 Tax=Zea mays TaxID=4577 RepID=K7UVT9_MAIZE|nr:hypothetical protein ZEAMMB73_Zm00001d009051 [Zea mays]
MARPSSSIARALLFSIAARARPWSFLAARPAPLPQLVLLPSIAAELSGSDSARLTAQLLRVLPLCFSLPLGALLPCRAPLSYFPARRRALSSPAATPAQGFLVPCFCARSLQLEFPLPSRIPLRRGPIRPRVLGFQLAVEALLPRTAPMFAELVVTVSPCCRSRAYCRARPAPL